MSTGTEDAIVSSETGSDAVARSKRSLGDIWPAASPPDQSGDKLGKPSNDIESQYHYWYNYFC